MRSPSSWPARASSGWMPSGRGSPRWTPSSSGSPWTWPRRATRALRRPVETRHTDEGAVLAAGAPVLTLVESGHLEARVGVAADAVDDLRPGAVYAVRVDGVSYDAVFRRALPATDAVTRSRTVVLDLPAAAAARVVPGQLARLAVTERVEVEAVWVPADALVRGVRGLWSAYAAEPGADGPRVVRHHVEVLHLQGSRALVRGTLGPQDQVLVGDTSRVVPGQLVVPRLANEQG